MKVLQVHYYKIDETRKNEPTKLHNILACAPPWGTCHLTFEMIHMHLHHALNWQIKTELLSEDIRYFRRVIATMRAMMGSTGQYGAKLKFDDLWNRVVALEKHYGLHD